jgi:hypothetical protein
MDVVNYMYSICDVLCIVYIYHVYNGVKQWFKVWVCVYYIIPPD